MKLTTEFIERIEEEYLKILIKQLQEGDIDTAQAKQLSIEFLNLTPFQTSEDMETKIRSFTEAHPEFGGIYVNLLKYEDEARTSALLNQMRTHMKNNDVDQALHLANRQAKQTENKT